jgi:CDP-glycerol glycerophosphotransferase (TagB/SpsB family)
LRDIAAKLNLRIVFALHPNAAMYLEDMHLPEWVEAVDVRQSVPYQALLARARVGITDYSSTVIEVAYLQRPVVYFQFDSAEFFSGNHVYQRGYFSYERDGFGPVATTPDDLISFLEEALGDSEDPVYSDRRKEAFPFRDGGCCERVCIAVDRLFAKRPGLSPLHATQHLHPALEPIQAVSSDVRQVRSSKAV